MVIMVHNIYANIFLSSESHLPSTPNRILSDVDCLREFSTNILIHNSTTFKHNDYQNIVILTSGFPVLLKFHVALRPLPDKAIIKLQSVIRRKNKLQVIYQ